MNGVLHQKGFVLESSILASPSRLLILFTFIFWSHLPACGTFVPQPGIEPTSLALEAWSLYHWIIKEAPNFIL